MKRQLRQQIDLVDQKIRDLLVERLDLARQVMNLKEKTGEAKTDDVRERQILESVTTGVPAELKPAIRAVFEKILAEGKNLT